MENNKTGKYIKYAIGEIVLVVIGILIALQINNWNESRKEKNIRQDYYSQLLEDLNKDIQFSDATIIEFKENKKAFEEYFKIYKNDKVELVDIYKEFIKLTIATKSLSFNSSTLESLQNSGDIGLIPSGIRNKLIDLRRSQNLILKRADYLDKGKNEITQNVSLIIGSEELQDQFPNHTELNNYLGVNNKLSQLILTSEAAHVWKNLMEEETVNEGTTMAISKFILSYF